MIDDKARRRTEAVRSQAGAVAVTGCHQQVGRLGGLHDLPLDPSSANHLADIGSPQQPGTSRDQSSAVDHSAGQNSFSLSAGLDF